MTLALDLGNSFLKTAVFQGDVLIDQQTFDYTSFKKDLATHLKKYPKIHHAIISSVKNFLVSDFDSILQGIKINYITHQSRFPFKNLYQTPQTLGIDRMVLAAGAVISYPNQNRLIIDAGTCITYDFVDSKNHYRGGAIAPGAQLRYQSLHAYTSKLPLLTIQNPGDVVGNSTQQAIHSGVINGLCFEIQGFIDYYCSNYENFIIILTGGNADFLAKRLKNPIFANSNFLLQSLNQLFQYQQND